MKRLVEEMGNWYTGASVVRTGGPERIYDADAADLNWKPRAVGFTAALTPAEREPLTWEGDGA